VIDYCINLIKSQDYLKCQSGGRVHIENAFQFNFLKWDGDVETKTYELYPIQDMSQICSAEWRVLLYLDHDMVNMSLKFTLLLFACILFFMQYL
jgi:sentrin-specific protease 1